MERLSRSPRPLLRYENVPIDWSHLSHLLVHAGSCAGVEGAETLTACPFACPFAAQLLPKEAEEVQMVTTDTLRPKAFRSVSSSFMVNKKIYPLWDFLLYEEEHLFELYMH